MDRIFINGDIVYLKKGWFGWGVVHPWRNPNRTINWFNFLTGGSWLNLIMVIIFVVLIVGAIYEYTHNIKILLDCFNSFQNLETCKQTFGDPALLIKP